MTQLERIILITAILLLFALTATAQEPRSCVENALAGQTMPTTLDQAQALIQDLRDVIDRCSPPSKQAMLLEVVKEGEDVKLDNMYQDNYGCLVFVQLQGDWIRPSIRATAINLARPESGFLVALRPPDSLQWERPYLSSVYDNLAEAAWYTSERKEAGEGFISPPFFGRYQLRYEPYIDAIPVTIAFDVELSEKYMVYIACPQSF